MYIMYSLECVVGVFVGFCVELCMVLFCVQRIRKIISFWVLIIEILKVFFVSIVLCYSFLFKWMCVSCRSCLLKCFLNLFILKHWFVYVKNVFNALFLIWKNTKNRRNLRFLWWKTCFLFNFLLLIVVACRQNLIA